ncbi:MAG TPA: hypothetical protein VF221_09750 [Chloroflexota bacterium]
MTTRDTEFIATGGDDTRVGFFAADYANFNTGVGALGTVNGVYGESSGGTGVHGRSRTGIGITGWNMDASNPGVVGMIGGAPVPPPGTLAAVYGSAAVVQEAPTIGVQGVSDTGDGVRGESATGYGGYFRGGMAPLRLEPGSHMGPPPTGAHQVGELWADAEGNLFVYHARSGWREIVTRAL